MIAQAAQVVAAEGLTTGGWVLMLLSIGTVLSLVGFCLGKVLR